MSDYKELSMLNIPDNLDSGVKSSLKNALTEVFKLLLSEIHEVMDDLEEPRDRYHVNVYPFSIERVDGKKVPRRLLKGIQAKLQKK